MKKVKAQIEKILNNIGRAFSSEERETSILYEHSSKTVYLETTEPYTARRWYRQFKDDPNVIIDHRVDSFKMEVPQSYCRKPELMIKAKFRREDSVEQ
jgi:hypothetical protein